MARKASVSYPDGEFCFMLLLLEICHGAYFQRISRSSGQCDGPYPEFLVFLLSDVVLLCFHIYVCLSVFKEGAENIKRVKPDMLLLLLQRLLCGDLAVYSLVLHRWELICYHQGTVILCQFFFQQQACSDLHAFCSSTKRESAGSSCSLCCHALYFTGSGGSCRHSGMECR